MLKVIDVLVALAAEIEPSLRILMNKEWSVGADITNTVELKDSSFPGIPSLRRKDMGRRTQAQEIQHHHFAVAVPAILQETTFGSPAMGKDAGIFGKPVPIDTIKNLVGELAYFGMLEILAASEDATKQNGSVHR